MASDTSLIFNLIARERVSEGLAKVREKFDSAATGIAAGIGGALGYGVASSLDMGAASAKLAAQLGLNTTEAASVGKTAGKVYSGGWGDSMDTVNEAIRGVTLNIGDLGKGAAGGLQGMSSKALMLSQTFDQDLGGATTAVGQMLRTGLASSADQAFDIITAGLQAGADKSGGFLDTLNEYGTQFRKMGIDGQTATGLLSQGLKAGARDGDLVADAIKEFSIRAIDGSTTTAQGFKMIGLNASDMATRIGKGRSSASSALDETLDRLRGIKDPVLQSQAAVALFGTQARAARRSLSVPTGYSGLRGM